MDPLSAVSGVFTILQATILLSNPTFKAYYDIRQARKGVERSLLGQNYGWLVATFVTILSPETATQYEEIDANVLQGGDEETLAFRQAITDESNMTAIAGAIIAQVGITGLSLPNLSLMHWIARACFLVAVVAGCLSVYYACALQRIIGKLYKADLIKGWLRLPPTEGTRTESKEDDAQRTSLAAVLIISAPFTMVRVAIFAFLLGLVIYQGFVFTKELDTIAGRGDSRAIFIAIMVATGLCLAFFTFTFSAKDIESTLRIDLMRSKKHDHAPDVQSEPRSNHIDDAGALTKTEEGLASHQEEGPAHASHSQGQDNYNRLASALEAAAQAHIQCAEADRQVALEYARLSEAA